MTVPEDQSANDVDRNQKIEEIRKAIEAGEYDTEERMEKALRKFLQQNDE